MTFLARDAPLMTAPAEVNSAAAKPIEVKQASVSCYQGLSPLFDCQQVDW